VGRRHGHLANPALRPHRHQDKSNAPGAHTFPEIVLACHGKVAHATYPFYGLATTMLVGACLVLGGGQVVAALSAWMFL
jgi:hypothetical protein